MDTACEDKSKVKFKIWKMLCPFANEACVMGSCPPLSMKMTGGRRTEDGSSSGLRSSVFRLFSKQAPRAAARRYR